MRFFGSWGLPDDRNNFRNKSCCWMADIRGWLETLSHRKFASLSHNPCQCSILPEPKLTQVGCNRILVFRGNQFLLLIIVFLWQFIRLSARHLFFLFTEFTISRLFRPRSAVVATHFPVLFLRSFIFFHPPQNPCFLKWSFEVFWNSGAWLFFWDYRLFFLAFMGQALASD